MKKIASLFLYFLQWLLFFEIARILFFCFNLSDKGNMGIGQLFSSMYHGIWLDLSAISYLSVLPFLFISFSFLRPKLNSQFLLGFHLVLLFLISLLIVTDALLYHEWGYHIEKDVLQFIKQPQGAIDSISIFTLIGLLLLIAALTFVFQYLTLKTMRYGFKQASKSIPLFVLSLLLTMSLVIPIRGGVSNTPLSIASAYYSNNSFANHLAYNTLWNFGFSFAGDINKVNKWKIASENELLSFDSYTSKSQEKLIHYPLKGRPNVIYIALESFTAGVSSFFGGSENLTPQLDELAQKGISFSACYASGDRSDEGLASLYTGFPGFPGGSILELPAKTAKLPNVLQAVKQKNYTTAFVCGSDLNFANIRTLLLNGEVDHIVEKKDYKASLEQGKWGVHDGPMYTKAVSTLKSLKQPFFCGIYSISSHAPYAVPAQFGYTGKDADFKHAFRYADSCLGSFIQILKKEGLWENTVIVITADHGIRQPNNCEVNSPEKYHVPLVITGGAVKETKQIAQITSHTDLPVGILHLLNMGNQTADFKFSKNPWLKQPDAWCSYLYTEGIGTLSRNDTSIYDLKLNRALPSFKPSAAGIARAKAYLHHMALYLEAN